MLLFVLLAAGHIATKRPWTDEAWFASPAYDLAFHGRMGTHILDPSGSHLSVLKPGIRLERIEQHTYWVMPLHFLVLALAFKILGFSLIVLRLPALLWGLAALASWYVIVRRLGGSKGLAILAIAFIGVDFAFADAASDGRMDMMCASLGFLAMAIYLKFRETRLHLAVLLSNIAAALGIFTHPNGIFASVSLVFVFLYLDRKRFHWPVLFLAGLPYVVGALSWSLYILQDRAAFVAQLGGNASIRKFGLLAPLESIRQEIAVRYLYGHFAPPSAGLGSRMKVLIFAAYVAATLIVAAVPVLRRHPGFRLLLYLAGLRFLMMAWGADSRNVYYLIYIIPFYAFFLACAAYWLWQQSYAARWMTVLALCVVIGLQLGWSLYRILRLQPYQKEYLPAVQFLKEHTTPDDLICGSAELAFAFGFDNPRIVDDLWVGRWSGKRPTVLVVDKWQYYQIVYSFDKKAPAYFAYISMLLKDEFHLIYTQRDQYQIFRRNSNGN